MSDLSAELASGSAFFLRSTAPAQNAALHASLPAGSTVRASAAVTIDGNAEPIPLSNSQTLEAFQQQFHRLRPRGWEADALPTSESKPQAAGTLLSTTGMLLHCTDWRHSPGMALVLLALVSSASRVHRCTPARTNPSTGSGLGTGAVQ
jgi:hypothetical protein